MGVLQIAFQNKGIPAMWDFQCETQKSPGKTRISWSPYQNGLPTAGRWEHLSTSSCPSVVKLLHEMPTLTLACLHMKVKICFFRCPKKRSKSRPRAEWDAAHLRWGTVGSHLWQLSAVATTGVKEGREDVSDTRGASSAGHDGYANSLGPWPGRSSDFSSECSPADSFQASDLLIIHCFGPLSLW